MGFAVGETTWILMVCGHVYVC